MFPKSKDVSNLTYVRFFNILIFVYLTVCVSQNNAIVIQLIDPNDMSMSHVISIQSKSFTNHK